MHVTADDEHYVSLSYISAFLRRLGALTVLDVGCGTGRTSIYLRENNPETTVYGVEPVRELLDAAVEKGVSKRFLVNGSGLALSFKNNSFDAVVECGVLHHVREPERVVAEMMRVARKGVFLSDSNIFGQGRPSSRLLKLALYKAGLWRLTKLLQTGGKGYTISRGDGLAYSYSVYFQHACLRDWSDRVISIPVRDAGRVPVSWSPVCTADTVLLCGMRDEMKA
jgi:ubiquinone/menaquinone biosynthesis C-methylase UbiE